MYLWNECGVWSIYGECVLLLLRVCGECVLLLLHGVWRVCGESVLLLLLLESAFTSEPTMLAILQIIS